ncbi:DUF2934 domain-containing protein [Caballeronia sp. INDeC2]|uniref:DUF2934 domain-containing protein n=1 Tax=Caballeronia sp. INDeC2 TaxID=2921747 RepID=UPI002027BF0A|nr:DUF2934 domain-containing protein [Caballeronia sp. INDeC2]
MDFHIPEDQIRSCAYRLWVDAGRPEGRAEEFWEQARLQLAATDKATQSDLVEDSDEFAAAPSAPSSETKEE